MALRRQPEIVAAVLLTLRVVLVESQQARRCDDTWSRLVAEEVVICPAELGRVPGCRLVSRLCGSRALS